MRLAAAAASLLISLALMAAGCEITSEKIETWKGTTNGPKKLAGTLIDPEVPTELRAQAGRALVEIHDRELFMESFRKMEADDAARVIDVLAPLLVELMRGDGSSEKLANVQIYAKDALFIVYDYAKGSGKQAAQEGLIEWSVADYNNRAMAGDHRIRSIIKKVGAPAAEAMIELLSVDQIVVKYIAELIRVVDDDQVNLKASKHLADNLAANPDKIRELHLEAAFVIGGDPIAQALIDLASNAKLSAKLQRFALRAFSQGVQAESISYTAKHAERLFAIAESEEADRFQREETYYVIAQGGRAEDIPQVTKLLANEDSFFRAVGFRCLLRMDGEGQLEPALVELARRTKDEEDVTELIVRTSTFPKLLPKVRELAGHSSAFVQGVAVNVLSALGKEADVKLLEGLKGSRARLPSGFEHKTVGEAAGAAVQALTKKG